MSSKNANNTSCQLFSLICHTRSNTCPHEPWSYNSYIVCPGVVRHRHYCAAWLCSVVKHLCRSHLLTGHLSRIENVKYQRLNTLTRMLKCGNGIRNAYEWVQQSRQAKRFRGPVYGPILLEVECHNELHTWYLENQVGSKDPVTLDFCCMCYPGVWKFYLVVDMQALHFF